MPTITRTINDPAEAQLLVDAYCGIYSYDPIITNAQGEQVPNPESRARFAERMFDQRSFHSIIKQWRKIAASKTAEEAPNISVVNPTPPP